MICLYIDGFTCDSAPRGTCERLMRDAAKITNVPDLWRASATTSSASDLAIVECQVAARRVQMQSVAVGFCLRSARRSGTPACNASLLPSKA
jgi:hypothetical protein